MPKQLMNKTVLRIRDELEIEPRRKFDHFSDARITTGLWHASTNLAGLLTRAQNNIIMLFTRAIFFSLLSRIFAQISVDY